MCYAADRKDGRMGTACRDGGCTRSFLLKSCSLVAGVVV